jgi:hypothetical protein
VIRAPPWLLALGWALGRGNAGRQSSEAVLSLGRELVKDVSRSTCETEEGK